MVHGIPGPYRLSAGEVVSVDVGVTLDGWVADAARTFAVGEISVCGGQPSARDGVGAARGHRARAARQPRGRHLARRSSASAEGAGLAVIRSLVGHGVGREMHEEPQVPNFGSPGKGPLLEEGMVLAIEPMTSAGRPEIRVGADGWAVFTQDGSLAAHFEFTVAVTDGEPAHPHALAALAGAAGSRRRRRAGGPARRERELR